MQDTKGTWKQREARAKRRKARRKAALESVQKGLTEMRKLLDEDHRLMQQDKPALLLNEERANVATAMFHLQKVISKRWKES